MTGLVDAVRDRVCEQCLVEECDKNGCSVSLGSPARRHAPPRHRDIGLAEATPEDCRLPPPFLCIEEPENGLYHKLLETLVQEFRARATGQEADSQVFVTTHQPYLVDALDPEEVWILEKGEDGFASIRRASDDPTIVNMAAEGLPLGGLWYSDYLDPR